MAAGIRGRRVADVLGQRDVHLLAGRADVEPDDLVDLGGGDGPQRQAQGAGVEVLSELEGVVRDGDVDVVQARDERARGRRVLGRGDAAAHGGVVS